MSYQDDAVSFAVFENELYPFLALCEEAGEVAGVMAKHIRKGGTIDTLTQEQHGKLVDELGDVMWNIANCCELLNVSVEYVQWRNITKLADRKVHGTIAETDRGGDDGE